MKFAFSIIFIIIFCTPSISAADNNDNNKKNIETGSSFYELKTLLINNIKNEAVPPISFNSENAFLIIGIASMAAFIVSVLVFKNEIFGTLPLTLFAVGVAGIIMGT